MRQKEIELAWAKTENKVSVHEESEEGTLSRRMR